MLTQRHALREPQKIAVIGNSGGGKTELSRRLAKFYQLPLTHIDSIQFDSKLQIRPRAQTIQTLSEIQKQSHWVIDGFGPLDILESRLQAADLVVFVDLPLWRHYFWSAKRLCKSALGFRRTELPAGSKELNFMHVRKLISSMLKMHQQMRPELLRILNRPELRDKVIHIRYPQDLWL